jgi:hypothetical protein
LIRLVESGTISGPIAKQVFGTMLKTGEDAAAIVERDGLGRIDDERAIEVAVRAVLAARRPRGAVPGGQDPGIRLPGRTGDEGDARSGESAGRERHREAVARAGRRQDHLSD